MQSSGDLPVSVTALGKQLRGAADLVPDPALFHSADVFAARRATRLGERLILKVLRSATDEPLLRNEQSVLEALSESRARGGEHFYGLLPQRAALLISRNFARHFHQDIVCCRIKKDASMNPFNFLIPLFLLQQCIKGIGILGMEAI